MDSGLLTPEQLGRALAETWLNPDGPSTLWQNLIGEQMLDLDQVQTLQQLVHRPPSTDDPVQFLPEQSRRYEQEKRLGAGGMGIVRQVRDRSLGRSVAMKQLNSDALGDDEPVGTLLAEARVAGMLEHPNIIPIYDVGMLGTGEPYYTMRLMDQMSLEDVLAMLRSGNPEAGREFPLVRLLRVFQQVCLAVDYAHSRGVIHRDLKPDNIRLGRYGEVQVVDWGLAKVEGLPDLPLRKALQDAHARGEIDPCIVIGSPNYMSPEQACGLNDALTPAADIYCLGAILYELLTLAVPFEDTDTMILLDMVEKGDMLAPSLRAPDRIIPPVLEELCMDALEKDPVARIQDVRVFWRTVEDYLEGHRDRTKADSAAFDLIQKGHRFSEAWQRLRDARDRLAGRLIVQTDAFKRRRLELDFKALELEVATIWGEAYDSYTRAVGFNPEDLVARAKLAELAFGQLSDAEARGDDVQAQFYWNMLGRYNDGGWDTYLVGTTALHVRTEPEGATVSLRSFSASFLEGKKETATALGRAPIDKHAMQAGLYLLTVELMGYRVETRPVFMRASRERTIEITLSPI